MVSEDVPISPHSFLFREEPQWQDCGMNTAVGAEGSPEGALSGL